VLNITFGFQEMVGKNLLEQVHIAAEKQQFDIDRDYDSGCKARKNDTFETSKREMVSKKGKALPGSDDGTYFSKHSGNLDYMFSPWNNHESMQNEALSESTAKTSAVQTIPNVKEDEIAAAESRDLSRYRLFIFIVLLLSMIGTAVAVYLLMSSKEQEKYTDQFREDAKKVLDSIGKNLDVTLSAIDALAVSLVSYSQYSNSTWPFVTMPDFAVHSAKARSLSRAVFLVVYPYVLEKRRIAWEKYSVLNDAWVEDGIKVQEKSASFVGPTILNYTTLGVIHDNEAFEREGDVGNGTTRPGPYMPIWQSSPIVPKYPPYNWDLLSASDISTIYEGIEKHKAVLYHAYLLPDPENEDEVIEMGYEADFFSDYIQPGEEAMEPLSDIYYPLINNINSINIYEDDGEYCPEENEFVGFISLSVYWRDMLKDILPPGSQGIDVVVKNKCNPTFTYQINGPRVRYKGRGDVHDKNLPHLEMSSSLINLDEFSFRRPGYTGAPIDDDLCPFFLYVYPSTDRYTAQITDEPMFGALCSVGIFAFTSMVFLIYDCLVERRQKKVMHTARASNAVVSELYPSVVRDRMFPVVKDQASSRDLNQCKCNPPLNESSLREREKRESKTSSLALSIPIADLFPDTTVMFADIAGFTAWSSTRDPTQVFTLLETLYRGFDKIAAERRVFKVETIGDSYVAVVGLPDSRKDHAVVMSKFARDCREKATQLLQDLEITLGPETAELQIRFGLNSGPVTAGVLRGEKSRFQLFGDTVNTAARMESLGENGRIQVSQATADLLDFAGKGHWVTPRDHPVQVKGKGLIQTFWVEPKAAANCHYRHPKRDSNGNSASSSTTIEMPLSRTTNITSTNVKSDRRIDWNTDVFARIIRQIIARRNKSCSSHNSLLLEKDSQRHCRESLLFSEKETVLDEVKDIIDFRGYQKLYQRAHEDPDSIVVDVVVLQQLRALVTNIKESYHDNPFHNFEHACHVVMSTIKLFSHCSPSSSLSEDVDQTYGIFRDPLTQFACVFAALIHDVDHPGVPNARLLEEKAEIAVKYKGKSIAEQNSVDVAWAMFMDEKFIELRKTLCSDGSELKRLRQLVVNSVIATDIMDADLKEWRNARWVRAFQERTKNKNENTQDITNRKATIVIEHIIQASDVAHTMQHWHIYRKWNERLFMEMYDAYRQGRSDKDPFETWYNGELGFFDFYIIPLAKKLKECCVFGNEYLEYAQKNREEWEARGNEIMSELSEKVRRGRRTIKSW